MTATAAGCTARTRSWWTAEQLESGEAMSDDFKKIAAREIEEFKAEYRVRFPGRDAESLTDEDLLREVMNTVGKAGKLGEHVKCVVSVSMLTEGWDANTVTHILGVRAFGTQLLCEQVVGRGLRRMSYAANDAGPCSSPEYAEVYGVPFSFIPCSGATDEPKPGPMPTRVRALEDRIACEITFPRLLGYRYDLAGERLTATFTDDSQPGPLHRRHPHQDRERAHRRRDRASTPWTTCKRRRPNEVAFLLAKLTLETLLPRRRRQRQAVALPAAAGHRQRWLAECVDLKDNTFPQLLLLIEFAHDAADRIYQAIVASTDGTADAQADPAPLRHGRLHALRGLRHHPPGLRHPRRQVPHLPRRGRHRLVGAEDGPDAGRHARGACATSRTTTSASPSPTR